MTDSTVDQPVEMRIALRGVEPSERFTAALDELGAAAAELLQGLADDDAAGFSDRVPAKPAGLLDYEWIATIKPTVREYVYVPEFKQ